MLEKNKGKIKHDLQLSNHSSKATSFQEDFSFQLESTWYQFTNLIKILGKFSDFIYVKLSKTQFSI